MGGDLLTFDEALAELQMATHELRSLVAQGEIRAFRDEDVLKFRRTDILDLKKSRETQAGGLVIQPEDMGDESATIAEPPEAEAPAPPGPAVKPAKHETEETELLAGIGQGASLDFLGLDEGGAPGAGADTAQTVVPTIEISDEDLIDDTARTVVPGVSSGETDVLGVAETVVPPTLVPEEEATEMATQEVRPGEEEGAPTAQAAGEAPTITDEPLRFQDETAPSVEELGITTEDVAAAGATAGLTAPRRAQKYEKYLAEATAPAAAVPPVFLVLAIVTFLVLLFAVPIFYGLIQDQAPDIGVYKKLLQSLGGT